MSAAKSSFFQSSSRKVKTADNKTDSGETSAVADEKNEVTVLNSKIAALEGKSKDDSLTEKTESPLERKFFLRVLILSGGLIFLFLLTFLASFLLNVRGAEKTKVPDLEGLELIDGIMALQEKGLNVRIQQRYSDNPQDKGTILDQQPSPGTYTRTGRNVQIIVSKGGIIDTVGEYVGRDFEEVVAELETLFLTHKPLINITDDVIFVYDPTPAGTILEQDPPSGTEISSPVTLNLVVSRGADDRPLTIEDYTGKNYLDTLAALNGSSQPYRMSFSSETRTDDIEVVTQTPRAGDTVSADTIINMIISIPKNVPRDYGYGIISYEIPVYDTYSNVKVVKIGVDGTESDYFSIRHPGGTLTIPYMEEEGTVFVISVFGKEVTRYNVTEND